MVATQGWREIVRATVCMYVYLPAWLSRGGEEEAGDSKTKLRVTGRARRRAAQHKEAESNSIKVDTLACTPELPFYLCEASLPHVKGACVDFCYEI